MEPDFIPVLFMVAVPKEDNIRFLNDREAIDIGPQYVKEIWQFIELANGRNRIQDIMQLIDIPEDDFEKIVTELIQLDIIGDARYQGLHFQHISNYPASINSNLTQNEILEYTHSPRLSVKEGEIIEFHSDDYSALRPIVFSRRSCRNFTDRRLTRELIGNICRYGYSVCEHAVPSGGALYPLKIFILIEEDQEGIELGYYEYDAEQNKLVRFSDEVDIEQLKYCFNMEEMPFKSSVQLLIAGDLNRQAYKYANRGYRLTLIEVGHVAQNINLYCNEKGLATCEMGGVHDELMKQELDLKDEVWPLLAIAIGYPSDCQETDFNKILFVEENRGDDKPVKSVWTRVFGKDGSFFGAASTYVDQTGTVQFAGSTSTSFDGALFKAAMEGYERWCSGQVRKDFYGSASELKSEWLDPRRIVPLTREQCQKCGVKPFDEKLALSWTKGTRYDGTEVYVPSDIVYYGQIYDENQIYFSNSSGIAAHFDYEAAKKHAIVELIERDAIMRNWFSQETPIMLDDALLPVHARRRKEYWQRQGRHLKVLQLSSSYGYVFETIITSDKYPCLTCGASVTLEKEKIEDAIIKSLQEAEYILLLALDNPEVVRMDPQTIMSPDDHGRFYYYMDNLDKIEWLWRKNPVVKHIEDIPLADDYEKLNEYLEVVTIDLSQNDSRIKVVRAFSPKLVPIYFGFHSAHYTHPELRKGGEIKQSSLMLPHYFA